MFRTILVPVDLAELDVSKKAIEVAPTRLAVFKSAGTGSN